ncbi:hypothetical protein Tco_0461214 [Tanacetum coccineum]
MSAKDTIAMQRCGLSVKELNEFLSSYPIPLEYDVILPKSTQTIFDAPPGYVGLYTHSFSLANLSDYAGASLDRKSTTGGCQFLGCRLISWQCKKQIVVANSTTEAEYIAASSCCGQHIEIRHHFIKDSNEKKLIQMIKIHTDKNVADLLTKAFDVTIFQYLIASYCKGKTVTGKVKLQALVDGKKVIITETSVRRDLQLEDAEGIECLPNADILSNLLEMGYEKPSKETTFYKAFFSPQWKFLIHTILQCLSAKSTAWNEFSRQFWPL